MIMSEVITIIGTSLLMLSLISGQLIGVPATEYGFWSFFLFSADLTLLGIILEEYNANDNRGIFKINRIIDNSEFIKRVKSLENELYNFNGKKNSRWDGEGEQIIAIDKSDVRNVDVDRAKLSSADETPDTLDLERKLKDE